MISFRASANATAQVTLCMMHPQDIARAHAFARILGYFITDGSMVVSKRWDSYSGKLSLGQQIDVDQALTDIQLVCGTRCAVSMLNNAFQVFCSFVWALRHFTQMNLPVVLLRDLHHAIGIQPGKCVTRATLLPECVMQPNCPKSFVREFLGGLYGGDGHAPYPANHTNSWHSVAFSMSKVPSLLPPPTHSHPSGHRAHGIH